MTVRARAALGLAVSLVVLTGCSVATNPADEAPTNADSEAEMPIDVGEPMTSNDVADILRKRFDTGVMPNLSSYPDYFTLGWHDCTFGIKLPEGFSSSGDTVTVSGRYGDGWYEDYRVPTIDLPEVTTTFDEVTPEFISANYDTVRCGP